MNLSLIERLLLAVFIVSFFGIMFSAIACSGSSSSTTTDADADGRPSDAGVPDSPTKPTDGGSPSLTALSLLAPDAAPPVTLTPSFAPGIYDYYVSCQAGTNTFTVSMTAAPGDSSELLQPTTSSSSPKQTLSVSVDAGSAVVAAATRGSAETEYWVRCLPPDFPLLAWTPHAGASQLTPGYYLVGVWWPGLADGAYAMILDSNGVPVWYSLAPAYGVADVASLAPGAVTFFPFTLTAVLPFETLDLVTKTEALLSPAGYVASLHEINVARSVTGSHALNGNYLIIATPLTSGVDLTGFPLSPDAGTLGPNTTIQDCAIVEFSPDGGIVSTWLASDHFDPAEASVYASVGAVGGTGTTAPDGGEIDIFHCNSIDVDPANGNLLISARHMDSVFYIDRSTTSGKVLWKMGGKNSSKDNATYVTVDSPFSAQHDGRLLPGWSQGCNGGAGQISVFDDESFTSDPARAAVYNVVVGVPDGGGGTDAACASGGTPGKATLTWQYKGVQNVGLGGSVRTQPDGTRVIGWGAYGATNWVMTEVDDKGNDLLDFQFPNGDMSYRAIKVPLSTFDINILRNTTGFQ
jgi:hypothetical protein